MEGAGDGGRAGRCLETLGFVTFFGVTDTVAAVEL